MHTQELDQDAPLLERPERPKSPLHQETRHESARKHANGRALYVDDLPHPAGMLHGLVITSPHAHARILKLDATKARALPGVHAVLFAADIPGDNQVGPVIHDEPLFSTGLVEFMGQSIGFIAAESRAIARAAAKLVEIEWSQLPPVLSIREAIAQGNFHSDPHVLQRGDVKAELAKAPVRLSGEAWNGGQDHFYLETQVSLVMPGEDGCVHIQCSTQHPSEVQAIVAHVLHIGRHQVTVEVPRMGGGFGGKETQAAPFAAMAALAATRLNRPVKVWLDRDQDMAQTGKRHPFWSTFDAGFTEDGRLLALEVDVFSDGGWSNDLSRSITDRALFHLDNAYFVPALRFTGRVCKTNLPSNTAFRGFGGPQGMVVMEEVLSRAAEKLGLDPAVVRERNLYGDAPRNVTPYFQEIENDRMPRIHAELMASSDYTARRAAIEAFNATSPNLKRGIGYQPVKFGISFTATFLNQAGAFAVLYSDGTLQLSHGGTEMGQGLHTKMQAVACQSLGLSSARIRVVNTATDKVPNTSATAASSGADLNGQAVKNACDTLRERLRPIAAKALGAATGEAGDIDFAGDRCWLGEKSVPFTEVVNAAYFQQISLSATGYYRTPGIHYDRTIGRGKPFHYFAYGAAVVEVELSGLTGEHRMTRVDVLHDVGRSLSPAIDRGQVEGAFIQGAGWLTCEEMLFDAKGRLLTHSPDTYKIPAMGDAPHDFRVALLENAPQPDTIHGSKAVGEPPLMLGIGVVGALRHAVGGFGPKGHVVRLSIPCTPEALLMAVEDAKLRR